MTGERDEIHSKFSEAILQMQQKSSLKYMILERKITTMREELDVKEAQLHSATKGELISISIFKAAFYLRKIDV